MGGEVQNSCTFIEPPQGAVVIEAGPVQLPRRIRRCLESFIRSSIHATINGIGYKKQQKRH